MIDDNDIVVDDAAGLAKRLHHGVNSSASREAAPTDRVSERTRNP